MRCKYCERLFCIIRRTSLYSTIKNICLLFSFLGIYGKIKIVGQIKMLYPAVEKVETMFKEFHSLLMGNKEEKLDEYLEKYGTSEIEAFCNGIKKDITPVKNAISFSVSSGFVEGNNNKFKVLKRIVYGRSGLVNLEKKCKLAFLSKSQGFSLAALL